LKVLKNLRHSRLDRKTIGLKEQKSVDPPLKPEDDEKHDIVFQRSQSKIALISHTLLKNLSVLRRMKDEDYFHLRMFF